MSKKLCFVSFLVVFGILAMSGVGSAQTQWTRIWPTEAPYSTCTSASGTVYPSTGENSATWFEWGCGNWKVFDVTPGKAVNISSRGDSCGGCVLYHINYDIYEFENGQWVNKIHVDGPDEKGAKHEHVYTPSASKIKLVATNGGFYVEVYQVIASGPETPHYTITPVISGDTYTYHLFENEVAFRGDDGRIPYADFNIPSDRTISSARIEVTAYNDDGQYARSAKMFVSNKEYKIISWLNQKQTKSGSSSISISDLQSGSNSIYGYVTTYRQYGPNSWITADLIVEFEPISIPTTPAPTITAPSTTTPTTETQKLVRPLLTIDQTTLKEEPEIGEEVLITVSILNKGKGTAKNINLVERVPSSISVGFVDNANKVGSLVMWQGELESWKAHAITHSFKILEDKDRCFPVKIDYEDEEGSEYKTEATICTTTKALPPATEAPTAPPPTTSPPGKGGICGPTSILLAALLVPAGLYVKKRRKRRI